LVSSLNLAAHKETYGFGSEDWLMAQKILEGKYKVGLKDLENNEGGTFEGNTIYLNEKLFGDGFDSSANILSVLRHEDVHIGGECQILCVNSLLG